MEGDIMSKIDLLPLYPKHKFQLYNRYLLSKIKHTYCQTAFRDSLKSSGNEALNTLWKNTANSTNIQCDPCISTKKVLKYFHLQQENKLRDKLLLQ